MAAVWALRNLGMRAEDVACIFTVCEKTVFNWFRETSGWSDTEKLQVFRLNNMRGKLRRRDIKLVFAGDSDDAEAYGRRYRKARSIVD